jgi:hypothetical protein
MVDVNTVSTVLGKQYVVYFCKNSFPPEACHQRAVALGIR